MSANLEQFRRFSHKSGRILPSEALDLLRHAPLTELMAAAHEARCSASGNDVHFVHSLNLNPTNICENQCGLCAFWRNRDADDAYTTSLSEARKRMEAAASWGLTDLHVVGGLTKDLRLDYYSDLFTIAKQVLPSTAIQGLTAVEIQWLADLEGLSIDDVLLRLKKAGLDAIPGGGAEIFSAGLRKSICPSKISAEQWLSVHRKAHSLGFPSNATMLFGHIETPEDIIDHLNRLRELQDGTSGFLAFCPLPFHATGTKLPVKSGPGGYTIVRMVALSRIFLDNFPHIRVLANFLDRKLLQTLLYCGADDIGGTSIDEQIARAAGAPDDSKFSSTQEMAEFIENMGFNPVLTNSIYTSTATMGQPNLVTCKIQPDVGRILKQAETGNRLSAEQAVRLHDEAPFYDLGRVAHCLRSQAVGSDTCTFIIDRNISFTNVCVTGCKFCAFHKRPGQSGAFVMPIEEIVRRVEEAAQLGATQIMLQGGLNPDLDLRWYERMLRAIKDAVEDIWLHSLSPAEVFWLAHRSNLTVSQTLERLRDAGLDSLPGGGAEILVDHVRQRVSPAKLTTAQWFEVMETAHGIGMSTTATMVYGLGETTAQRVEHLIRVRELQDRTHGFRAFIPWSFQSNKTQLSDPPQTGVDYLRMVAVSRLVLDNIKHVQAGWVTEGPRMAQLALIFGADDFGGVLMEESVVKATGIEFGITVEQIISLIGETGMIPAQRNTEYHILQTFGMVNTPGGFDSECHARKESCSRV
jgi:cyclic dehypoxanthinyl futalosine synthase